MAALTAIKNLIFQNKNFEIDYTPQELSQKRKAAKVFYQTFDPGRTLSAARLFWHQLTHREVSIQPVRLTQKEVESEFENELSSLIWTILRECRSCSKNSVVKVDRLANLLDQLSTHSESSPELFQRVLKELWFYAHHVKKEFPDGSKGYKSQEELNSALIGLLREYAASLTDLDSRASWIPFAGLFAGIGIGITNRLIRHQFSPSFLTEKSKIVCKTAFAHFPVLNVINKMGQWEIKNCALLSPLLPLLLQITTEATCSSKSQESIARRFYEAAKNAISWDQAVYLSSIALLSLTNPFYAPILGLSTDEFDASGHVMMKFAMANIASSVFSTLSQEMRYSPNPVPASRATRVAVAGTLLSVFKGFITDTTLMANCVANCHSLVEVAAGLGWGLGITTLSKGVQQLALRYFGNHPVAS